MRFLPRLVLYRSFTRLDQIPSFQQTLINTDEISHMTISPSVEKTQLKPHLKDLLVHPPQQNGAFVAAMEDVLAVYARPYSESTPVVCR